MVAVHCCPSNTFCHTVLKTRSLRKLHYSVSIHWLGPLRCTMQMKPTNTLYALIEYGGAPLTLEAFVSCFCFWHKVKHKHSVLACRLCNFQYIETMVITPTMHVLFHEYTNTGMAVSHAKTAKHIHKYCPASS